MQLPACPTSVCNAAHSAICEPVRTTGRHLTLSHTTHRSGPKKICLPLRSTHTSTWVVAGCWSLLCTQASTPARPQVQSSPRGLWHNQPDSLSTTTAIAHRKRTDMQTDALEDGTSCKAFPAEAVTCPTPCQPALGTAWSREALRLQVPHTLMPVQRRRCAAHPTQQQMHRGWVHAAVQRRSGQLRATCADTHQLHACTRPAARSLLTCSCHSCWHSSRAAAVATAAA